MLRFLVWSVVIAYVLVPSTADAASLTFRAKRPLELALKDQQRLASISVCNRGSRPLRRVAVTVKGFGFTNAAGKRLKDLKVIAPAKVRDSSPPARDPFIIDLLHSGRCRTFALRRAVPSGQPAPGTYTGAVVAIAKRGSIARRSVRLTVAASAQAAPATALDESVRLVAHTAKPAIWPRLQDAALADDQTVALVRANKPKGCRPKSKPETCFVGNLSHGPDVAWVYVNGAPEGVPDTDTGSRARAWRVPVQVVGADQIGEYKGTIDLGPGGDGSKPTVKLTVAVGDHQVYPILLVILIDIVGVIWLWWWRRHRPYEKLRDRLDEFTGEYAAAATAFHAPDMPSRLLIKPSDTKISQHVDAIRDAVKAYHDSTMLYDPSSPAYRAILASIDELQADVDAWSSSLGPAVDKLHAGMQRVLTAMPATEQPETPALVERGAALVAAAELEVGEAVARTKQANETTAALDVLEQLMVDYRHAADTLIKVQAAEVEDTRSRRKLERASALLDGAGWRLWHARALERLEQTATGARIAEAQLLLDELLPDTPAPLDSLYAIAAEHGYLLSAATGSLNRTGKVHDIGEWLEGLIGTITAAIGRAARSPIVHQMPGRMLEVLAFLITGAAALILAISALDTGDTFGTTMDYLKLLAATVTGPVVGLAALTAVGKLRAMRSDPLLRREAEPASVTS